MKIKMVETKLPLLIEEFGIFILRAKIIFDIVRIRISDDLMECSAGIEHCGAPILFVIK